MSVSLTDQDNTGLLQTYCYDNCSIDDNDDLKISRGLIYKDNKPFIKSFGFTPEFTTQNIDDENKQYIINNFKNFRFYHSVEGTLLRLYWNDINEKWYISSHKKLDARNSRWGSKQTFGEIIDTILPQTFYDSLNKEYCYLFILTPNQDNRIVCNVLMNNLFHVGTYAKDFALSFDFDINIPKPVELYFKSYEDMCNYVDSQEFKYMCYQGIIICDVLKQSNIKILNSNYNNLKNIRGNTPSIMFRYLEVRKDDNLRQALISMFPTHVQKFQQYEMFINNVTNKLFNEYIKRHIKKQFNTIVPNEHYILKLAHSWHCENRETNKISERKIYEIINKQTPVVINSLIKQYK